MSTAYKPNFQDFKKQMDYYKDQEKKIDCKVECPFKSYWECKRCRHNKGRFNM